MSKTTKTRIQQWHPTGRWWLAAGVVGALLIIFVGDLFLQQWPTLLAAIAVEIATLGYLGFKQIDLRAWSQGIGKSNVAHVGMGLLFLLGVGLMIYPGAPLIHKIVCGPFACAPTDVLRFAIDTRPAQKSGDAT